MKAIEEIKRIYDTPGRQWEKGALRGTRGTSTARRCSFEDMLREAILHREQIDRLDRLRAESV